MPLGRQKWQRWSRAQHQPAREFIGRPRHQLAITPDQRLRAIERMDHQPCQHLRPRLAEFKFERRNDTEIATAAPQRPEKVRILGRTGVQKFGVRGDHIRRNETVDSQAELAGNPAEAAPFNVKPAMPVVELMPVGTASPNGCVSRSRSASVAPGSTHALRAFGSTRTPFIPDRSITIPWSQIALPAM